MAVSPKTIRTQLSILKPLPGSCSLKTIRKGQDAIGELMEARYRRQVMIREHLFDHFRGAWVMPRDERRQGVILYLHGGIIAKASTQYGYGRVPHNAKADDTGTGQGKRNPQLAG